MKESNTLSSGLQQAETRAAHELTAPRPSAQQEEGQLLLEEGVCPLCPSLSPWPVLGESAAVFFTSEVAFPLALRWLGQAREGRQTAGQAWGCLINKHVQGWVSWNGDSVC